MAKAIYAFSGDPITYGHIDVVTRAAQAFDSLAVGIGTNERKSYLFSEDERLAMARKALRRLPNVHVEVFEGSLVHHAYEQGIDFIVRGVRNSDDAEDELQLYHNIESQGLPVDIILLPGQGKYLRVSSTAVKVWQALHGDITSYVPLHVKQALEERISGQHMLGITGSIGSGKSYVTAKLVEAGQRVGITVHEMDLDRMGHEILGVAQEPLYTQTRASIAAEFGVPVTAQGIDRASLGSIVFSDPSKLERLNAMMAMPMRTYFRKSLDGKKGIIALNAALIAELGWTDAVNNNALLIDVDRATQERRLRARGHDAAEVTRRISSQWSTDEKAAVFEREIAKHDHGRIWRLDNPDGATTDYESLLHDIAQGLN